MLTGRRHEIWTRGSDHQPELSSVANLTFAVRTQELQPQLPWWGWNSTKQKAPHLYNKFSALALPGSKTIQEVPKPFSRSDMSLRHCRTVSPDRLLALASDQLGVAMFTPRGGCSLHSAAGWHNVSAALGASPEVLEMMGAAVGHYSHKGQANDQEYANVNKIIFWGKIKNLQVFWHRLQKPTQKYRELQRLGSEVSPFLKAVKKERKNSTYVSQQLRIIDDHCGSTSLGISNLWFMKPTAPMTYVRNKPLSKIWRKIGSPESSTW